MTFVNEQKNRLFMCLAFPAFIAFQVSVRLWHVHSAVWEPAAIHTPDSPIRSEPYVQLATDHIVGGWRVSMERFSHRYCEMFRKLHDGSQESEQVVVWEDWGCSCSLHRNWRDGVNFIESCPETDSVLHFSLGNALELDFKEPSEKQSFQFSKKF